MTTATEISVALPKAAQKFRPPDVAGVFSEIDEIRMS
jgi:hypothetical protein